MNWPVGKAVYLSYTLKPKMSFWVAFFWRIFAVKSRTSIAVIATFALAVGLAAVLILSSGDSDTATADSTRALTEIPDGQIKPERSGSQDVPQTDAATGETKSTVVCAYDVGAEYIDLDLAVSEWSQSGDPEHLLIAALYAKDSAHNSSVKAMTKALRSDPNNPLIVWNFLHTCSESPTASICRNHHIEDRAIDIDGSNGHLWSRIAGYRMNRGDMPGALAALNKAVVAPGFSNYSMEHIGLFERGLAAAASLPYRVRMIQAIGMQSALVSNEGYVVAGCKTMAATSPQWLAVCTRLAQRWEDEGRSILLIAIGQSLQKRMLMMSGDDQGVALLQERIDATRQLMSSEYMQDGQVLLLNDDRVLEQYITEMATHGERRALEFLGEEVERVKHLEGDNPCLM